MLVLTGRHWYAHITSKLASYGQPSTNYNHEKISIMASCQLNMTSEDQQHGQLSTKFNSQRISIMVSHQCSTTDRSSSWSAILYNGQKIRFMTSESTNYNHRKIRIIASHHPNTAIKGSASWSAINQHGAVESLNKCTYTQGTGSDYP